jgi:hypothetical protein
MLTVAIFRAPSENAQVPNEVWIPKKYADGLKTEK